MRILNIPTLCVVALLTVLTACSTTKHLPEGEVLYTGIKNIQYLNRDKSSRAGDVLEEVEAAISVPPNNAFFGSASIRTPFPIGLWAYNRFARYESGFGKLMYNIFASEPVLISTVNPDTRIKVASNLLHDYGYFNGQVSYDLVKTKHPKKMKINYTIDMGHPYTLDSIRYEGFTPHTDSLVQATAQESLLTKGDQFDVTRLQAERSRLVSLFRNNGYYYYRNDFITFLADTIQRPGKVWLKVMAKSNIPAEALRRYHMGHTSVYLTGYNGEAPTASLKTRQFTLYYAGKKPGIRLRTLRERFDYRKGDFYAQQQQESTQEGLARLGIFKFSEFQYQPKDSLSDTLQVVVNSMFDLPYDAQLELNVTNKSTQQLGPGAIFTLSRKNFLRMGANLDLEVKGSYEWQTNSTVIGDKSVLNSYELGTSLSLHFPRIILPWLRNRINEYRNASETNFKIYINQLNRARYFKMLSFGGSVQYSFRKSHTWKHSVTPLQLTFNTLQHRTAAFNSIARVNPMLYHSLDNQFIPSMSYTVTFDNSPLNLRNQWWWEGSVTSAGNLTSLAYAVLGRPFTRTNKTLLGTPYAQFLKFTSEIRFLHAFDSRQQLATRLMGGIIWAYGNKLIAPYSEQFYVGGANSIRAFTFKSIGPGRFHPARESRYSYVDETGDIKFEANIEYRFRLVTNLFGGNLNGATFIDAGNVWLLRNDEARPLATFSPSRLLNDLAVGTGVGLRYDLSFLILRLDLGVALHVPYDTGKKGFYNIPRFKDGLGLHFAIGYPF